MELLQVDIFLLCIIVFYVVCCPYTKVEESFNMQAIHDLLEFGVFHLEGFDHLQFPGVVPRTFLGPLFLSIFCYPCYKILQFFEFVGIWKQVVCRSILGVTAWVAFVVFRSSIQYKFGKRAAQLFIILTSLQFHLCFYASRTLPNIFALVLCLYSFSAWLQDKALLSICIIAVAAVVFRCDMLILLLPTTLLMLVTKEISFWRSLFTGIAVTSLALGLTILVDSYFWKQWLWPEGVVLFFNTVENRSSEWGVMSWHWYFSNALPKSMHFNFIWILAAIIGIRYTPFPHQSYFPVQYLPFTINRNYTALYYTLPAWIFIVLYSYLPHKELRFVIPVLPMLTMLAAVGLHQILPTYGKELWFPLNELFVSRKDILALAKKDDDLFVVKKPTTPLDTKEKEATKKATNTKAAPAAPSLERTVYHHLISLAVLSSFLVMAVLANTFLLASFHNYPGAKALDHLLRQHISMQLAIQDESLENILQQPIFVHLDTYTATSGVTRFLQERTLIPALSASVGNSDYDLHEYTLKGLYFNCDYDRWLQIGEPFYSPYFPRDVVFYSKNENVTDFTQYDWLITEDSSTANGSEQFEIVERIPAFDKITLTKWGPQVELKTVLYIIRKNYEE